MQLKKWREREKNYGQTKDISNSGVDSGDQCGGDAAACSDTFIKLIVSDFPGNSSYPEENKWHPVYEISFFSNSY